MERTTRYFETRYSRPLAIRPRRVPDDRPEWRNWLTRKLERKISNPRTTPEERSPLVTTNRIPFQTSRPAARITQPDQFTPVSGSSQNLDDDVPSEGVARLLKNTSEAHDEFSSNVSADTSECEEASENVLVSDVFSPEALNYSTGPTIQKKLLPSSMGGFRLSRLERNDDVYDMLERKMDADMSDDEPELQALESESHMPAASKSTDNIVYSAQRLESNFHPQYGMGDPESQNVAGNYELRPCHDHSTVETYKTPEMIRCVTDQTYPLTFQPKSEQFNGEQHQPELARCPSPYDNAPVTTFCVTDSDFQRDSFDSLPTASCPTTETEAPATLPPLSVTIPDQPPSVNILSVPQHAHQSTVDLPDMSPNRNIISVEVSPNGTKRVLLVDRKVNIVVSRYDHEDPPESDEDEVMPSPVTPVANYKFVFKNLSNDTQDGVGMQTRSDESTTEPNPTTESYAQRMASDIITSCQAEAVAGSQDTETDLNSLSLDTKFRNANDNCGDDEDNDVKVPSNLWYDEGNSLQIADDSGEAIQSAPSSLLNSTMQKIVAENNGIMTTPTPSETEVKVHDAEAGVPESLLKKRVSFSSSVREIEIDCPHAEVDAPKPPFRKPIWVPYEKLPESNSSVDEFLAEAIGTGDTDDVSLTRPKFYSSQQESLDVPTTGKKPSRSPPPPLTVSTRYPSVEQALILGSAPLEDLDEGEDGYRPRSFSSNNLDLLCCIRQDSHDGEQSPPASTESITNGASCAADLGLENLSLEIGHKIPDENNSDTPSTTEAESMLSPASSLIADVLRYRREQECVDQGLSPSAARSESFFEANDHAANLNDTGKNQPADPNTDQVDHKTAELTATHASYDSSASEGPISPDSSTQFYNDVIHYRMKQACLDRGLSPSAAEGLSEDFLFGERPHSPQAEGIVNHPDHLVEYPGIASTTPEYPISSTDSDEQNPSKNSYRADANPRNEERQAVESPTQGQVDPETEIIPTSRSEAVVSVIVDSLETSQNLAAPLPADSVHYGRAAFKTASVTDQNSMNQGSFGAYDGQFRHRGSLDEILDYRKRFAYTSDADVVASQKHQPKRAPDSSSDEEELSSSDKDGTQSDRMDGSATAAYPDDPDTATPKWPFNAPVRKSSTAEIPKDLKEVETEEAQRNANDDGTRKKSSKVSKVPIFAHLYAKKSGQNLLGERKDTIQDIKQTGNVEETIYTVFKDDTGLVPIDRFLQAIYAVGISKEDYRLKEMVTNMQKINKHTNGVYEPIESLSLTKEEFAKCSNLEVSATIVAKHAKVCSCIQDNVVIITKVLRNKLIIPEWETFCEHITDIYSYCEGFTDGQNAQYIEQLARVDSSIWAVSVCTVDGQRFKHGRTDEAVCIQSCSKVLNYAKALQELGSAEVHKYVGQEPSGRMFNELALDYNSKPHNPLINSGAIVMTSLVERKDRHADRYDKMLKYYRRLAGGLYVGFNNAVFLSERATADRNFALAYYMRENKCFPDGTDLNETLDLYFQFQLCSVELTCESASVMAATLANGGICPITDDPVLNSSSVRDVLSLMLSCGMYDYSGHFAFNIGLPAKSGVSGLILLVVPNVMGVALWSPRLDRYGNSVRGVKFCEELVKRFNFHNYDNLRWTEKKHDPRQRAIETHGQTVVNLLFSAANGDVTALRRYKLRGINLGISDYDSRTALHLAAAEGHLDCVRFLLHKANVKGDPKDRWGHTPLQEAEANNHPEIVEMLKSYLAGETEENARFRISLSPEADEINSTVDSGVGGSLSDYYESRRAAEQI